MQQLRLCVLTLVAATTISAAIPTWKMPARSYEQREYRGSLRTRTEGACWISTNQSCPMSEMTNKEVVYVYPGGMTQCIDSDSPYRFVVFPGSTDKVLIYFQGGGACWNRASTLWFSSCHKKAEEYDRESFGVFERREPLNPYRDYTIVYVLYCSGDFFGGNATLTYGKRHIHQNGAENTRAVFNWIRAQNWAPQKLVLMGGSAGSLGLQLYAGPFLRVLKYKTAAVILDSFFLLDSDDAFYHEMFHKFRVCSSPLMWSWHPRPASFRVVDVSVCQSNV